MKIAIATPILFDKTSPFNHLFKDIIGGFLDAGYIVERHVAVRNDFEDDYKYGYSNERIKYITYKRKASMHSNIFSRYIFDTLTNIREAIGIKKSDADVLFEDVTYSSYWAVKAAKKRGMKVVAMIQDVWPDNAVQVGLIKQSSILYKFFELFQRFVYRNADIIVCISDDMKHFIASKGVDEGKIKVIYNWGYSDKIVNIPWDKNNFVKKYGFEKGFYAVYAGNIGKMQNVELVVRAAKIMPNVQFVIIGDGVKKEEIRKLAKNIDNIIMLPLQPPELAEHIYSMASVNIVTMVENGIKTAMPSKTGVILSCGRPNVFCFGNEAQFAKLVEQYRAGFCVSAVDETELLHVISLLIKENNYKCEGAQELFLQFFNKEYNVRKYSKVISDCISENN